MKWIPKLSLVPSDTHPVLVPPVKVVVLLVDDGVATAAVSETSPEAAADIISLVMPICWDV